MVIILNDDPVYLSWIRRHRNGFVLATRHKPTKRNTTLHRATCDEIRKSKSNRTHWTTGGRVKACSASCDELIDWSNEQIGSEPEACGTCDPRGNASNGAMTLPLDASNQSLTKLERDIVDAVVESAVIHLDNELEFRMTVCDVADYLSKTPRQISPALRKLVATQMLEVDPNSGNTASFHATTRIIPTCSALCTVPAFAALATDELQSEIDTLRV